MLSAPLSDSSALHFDALHPFHLTSEGAHFEATGWRAYYDRHWLKMVRLLFALCQEQFHIPFPQALLVAYYATCMAKAWAPANYDVQKVHTSLKKFYQIVHYSSGLSFDPTHVANLELCYYTVHLHLVGNQEKLEPLEMSIALHSDFLGLSPEKVHESAQFLLLALDTVDRVTSRASTDVEGDWARLEKYCCQCYSSLQWQLLPLLHVSGSNVSTARQSRGVKIATRQESGVFATR